ncbi:MAG TPA: hypothetical protein VN257_10450 [Actinotalea sp.]|nr:hypothetical protein [Actinotalea sp.]
MTPAANRGWLIAALVLAVALLVGSIAVAVAHGGPWGSAQDGPRWGSGQMWRGDDRGGRGMMEGPGWSEGRSEAREDCLEVMRDWEDR